MTTLIQPVRSSWPSIQEWGQSFPSASDADLGISGNEDALTAQGASAFTDLGFSGAEDVRVGWNKLLDELHRMLELEDDWDGEGSIAPHPALVSGAITLAQTLKANRCMPADRIVASVNGTVYFEWHTPVLYQEIEVISPLDAEVRWVPKGSDIAQVVPLNLAHQRRW